MMPLLPAGALAVVLLAAADVPAADIPAEVPAMTAAPSRALTLDVDDHGGVIEVRLIGLSDRSQQVSYALEVNGQSTSRHRGKTVLAAGTSAVLSTMRASAGENWCVRLVAEEEGSAPYEITQGSDCA
jgi:hypothetical protein